MAATAVIAGGSDARAQRSPRDRPSIAADAPTERVEEVRAGCASSGARRCTLERVRRVDGCTALDAFEVSLRFDGPAGAGRESHLLYAVRGIDFWETATLERSYAAGLDPRHAHTTAAIRVEIFDRATSQCGVLIRRETTDVGMLPGVTTRSEEVQAIWTSGSDLRSWVRTVALRADLHTNYHFDVRFDGQGHAVITAVVDGPGSGMRAGTFSMQELALASPWQ